MEKETTTKIEVLNNGFENVVNNYSNLNQIDFFEEFQQSYLFESKFSDDFEFQDVVMTFSKYITDEDELEQEERYEQIKEQFEEELLKVFNLPDEFGVLKEEKELNDDADEEDFENDFLSNEMELPENYAVLKELFLELLLISSVLSGNDGSEETDKLQNLKNQLMEVEEKIFHAITNLGLIETYNNYENLEAFVLPSKVGEEARVSGAVDYKTAVEAYLKMIKKEVFYIKKELGMLSVLSKDKIIYEKQLGKLMSKANWFAGELKKNANKLFVVVKAKNDYEYNLFEHNNKLVQLKTILSENSEFNDNEKRLILVLYNYIVEARENINKAVKVLIKNKKHYKNLKEEFINNLDKYDLISDDINVVEIALSTFN